MKFRLLDVLVCPKCGGFPLLLTNYVTERSEIQKKLNVVLCTKFCGLKGEFPSKVTPEDCEICLGTEIVAGELICKSCGARFGIYRGVPCLLIG